MDLSPGQRKAAFAAIAAALAGLGAFLLVPGSKQASAAPGAAASPSGGTPRPAAAPASPPPASPSAPPPAASTVDIYRLLPFSQADLNQAVGVTQRFAVAYGTYSYQESSAAYEASMRGLAAPGLAAAIERGFATPGVAGLRVKQKQVVTASATVTGMRAFGPSSLTFLVKVAQTTAAAPGRSGLTTEYAVTVVRAAVGWQVSDIQLATAGNS